jgi:hypothetical protein
MQNSALKGLEEKFYACWFLTDDAWSGSLRSISYCISSRYLAGAFWTPFEQNAASSTELRAFSHS